MPSSNFYGSLGTGYMQLALSLREGTELVIFLARQSSSHQDTHSSKLSTWLTLVCVYLASRIPTPFPLFLWIMPSDIIPHPVARVLAFVWVGGKWMESSTGKIMM